MARISEVLSAPIQTPGTPTATIVAAVTGAKIRVVSLVLGSAGAQTVKVQSDIGGTPVDKTGPVSLPTNGQWILPFDPAGWFESDSGKSLGVAQGGSTTIAGVVGYVLVG